MTCHISSNKVQPLNDLIEIRRGRKLSVNVLSPATKPKGTLLFIHGVGGSAWIWHKQCEYFNREGYRTVTIDLVGHGNSPLIVECRCCCHTSTQQKAIYASSNSFVTCLQCPRNKNIISECHFNAHFEDVQAIFDKFVLTFCPKDDIASDYVTILVGHSYGTSLAVRLAESRKDKVDRVVLISGGAPTPLEYEPSFLNFPAACLTCFVPCLRLMFQSLAFGPKHKPVLTSVDETDCDWQSTLSMSMEEEKERAFIFNAYTLRATMVGQIWPEGDQHFYSRLRMPVLLIVGCKDKLIKMKEDEETLFHLHCGRLRCIENAGHMSMLEDAQQVNRFIHEHINEPPVPAVHRGSEHPRLHLKESAITQQPSNIQPSNFNTDNGVLHQMKINNSQNNSFDYKPAHIPETEPDSSHSSVGNILTPRLHFKSASVKYSRNKLEEI